MSTKVEIFMDYVCPFCFLIEGAVAELQRDRDVQIRIRPFELRPDPVPTLRPEDEYLPRIWNAAVYPMAYQVGAEIRLPTVSPQPRTVKAFVVLQLANEQGAGQEYSSAMFRAFFQQDNNIGLDEVIMNVAVSVGLDRTEVEQALGSAERSAQHLADQNYAAEMIGVSVVPSFRVNGRLYPGVLDANRLKAAIDEVATSEQQP